jgi:hypothetical protein
MKLPLHEGSPHVLSVFKRFENALRETMEIRRNHEQLCSWNVIKLLGLVIVQNSHAQPRATMEGFSKILIV